MIAFSINNEFLDLPANPSVDLKRISTLFQFDGFIKDDFTLPISFPATGKNKRIFGFPHIPENANRLRPKWTAILWYNGVPRIQGEIRGKSPINKNVITANFVNGVSLIGDDISRRKLAEILDETITLHSTTITKGMTLQFLSGASARCAIVINDVEYEGTDLNDLRDEINAASIDITASVVGFGDDLTLLCDNDGEFEPFHVEVPDDVVFYVSQYIDLAPWIATYHTAINTTLAGYIGASRSDKKVRFGTFGNMDGFINTDSYPRRFPIVNYWEAGEMITNDFDNTRSWGSLTPEVINQNSLAPMITVKTVLEAIQTYYGITIDFFALNDDDVLFHTFNIDRPTKLFNDGSINLFEPTFNLNQLVPDMTINEFLKALQIGFNAEVVFNPATATLTISHREEKLTSRAYTDITDQCSEPSDVQNPTQMGIRFALQADTKDAVEDITSAPSDYLVGEGERVVQAGFGAPGVRDNTTVELWPEDAAPLSVVVNLPFESKFKLKLARYVDDVDTPFLDSRPFLWDGVTGLIETYWSESMEIENSPVLITNTWNIPRNKIFAPDWGEIFRIDRVDYLLRDFDIQLRNNGVSAAKCVFLKRPFFVEGTPPVDTTAWRVLESSVSCVKDGNNQNTGVASYAYLEQYDTVTDLPTGFTKINTPSDPDYIAPAENLSACPIATNDYQPGFLYIVNGASGLSYNEHITINGTNYQLDNFPYPYPMGAVTQVQIVVANHPHNAVQTWNVKLYQNDVLVHSDNITLGPNNKVDTGNGKSSDEIYRTFDLPDSLFDETKYNRIILTRTTI